MHVAADQSFVEFFLRVDKSNFVLSFLMKDFDQRMFSACTISPECAESRKVPFIKFILCPGRTKNKQRI